MVLCAGLAVVCGNTGGSAVRSAAAEAALKFKIVVLNRLVALLWTTVRDLRNRVQVLDCAQP